jgi:hypothetical protein
MKTETFIPTERRKVDRAIMANTIRSLCAEFGLSVTDREFAGPREIALEIKHPGGARLWLDFDGDSCQPDVHVACWNIDYESDARFSDTFGDVNPYHHRKSQFVAYGFEALDNRLRLDMGMLNDGTGYRRSP